MKNIIMKIRFWFIRKLAGKACIIINAKIIGYSVKTVNPESGGLFLNNYIKGCKCSERKGGLKFISLISNKNRKNSPEQKAPRPPINSV